MEQVGRAQHGVDVMRARGRADHETIREKEPGNIRKFPPRARWGPRHKPREDPLGLSNFRMDVSIAGGHQEYLSIEVLKPGIWRNGTEE